MSKRFFGLLVLVMSLVLIFGASVVRASGPGNESNPAALQQQSQNVLLVGQIGGRTRAVAVRGSYTYIGVGPRLYILNIDSPSSPSVVGQSCVLPGMVSDVAVSGSYAYVADGSSGLRIIDVSNPAAPTETGFYDTPWSALGVVVSGGYAYVADSASALFILKYIPPPPQLIYLPLVLRN